MPAIDPGVSLIDVVPARLKTEIPELKSVGTAADMARLINAKAMPADHMLPAAFVILPSDVAGQNKAPVGRVIQQFVTETVVVVLALYKHNDPTGAAALKDLEPLKPRLADALVGWSPGGSYDVLSHSRRQLTQAGGNGKLVVYLHELKTTWLMRR